MGLQYGGYTLQFHAASAAAAATLAACSGCTQPFLAVPKRSGMSAAPMLTALAPHVSLSHCILFSSHVRCTDFASAC